MPRPTHVMLLPAQALLQFMKLEAAGGILLVIASAIAMVWVNSPGGDVYFSLLRTKVSLLFGDVGFSKSLLHWINDGLMAIFFLLVGLEIKREVMGGKLATMSQAALPGIAAAGGMAIPAALYLAINWGNPVTAAGWAIPAATDIASRSAFSPFWDRAFRHRSRCFFWPSRSSTIWAPSSSSRCSIPPTSRRKRLDWRQLASPR